MSEHWMLLEIPQNRSLPLAADDTHPSLNRARFIAGGQAQRRFFFLWLLTHDYRLQKVH